LAQLNHPDKNLGDDTAAGRLMAVVKAYLVLSDPEQRRKYDLTDGAGQRVVERRGMGSAAANHSRPGDPQKNRDASLCFQTVGLIPWPGIDRLLG